MLKKRKSNIFFSTIIYELANSAHIRYLLGLHDNLTLECLCLCVCVCVVCVHAIESRWGFDNLKVEGLQE